MFECLRPKLCRKSEGSLHLEEQNQISPPTGTKKQKTSNPPRLGLLRPQRLHAAATAQARPTKTVSPCSLAPSLSARLAGDSSAGVVAVSSRGGDYGNEGGVQVMMFACTTPPFRLSDFLFALCTCSSLHARWGGSSGPPLCFQRQAVIFAAKRE